MSWQGQSVLITGAGGFIGSHVTERLVELGARVRAFIRYNGHGDEGWLKSSPVREHIEVLAGDVCDRESVDAAVKDVGVVFHLAALIAIPYSYQCPESYVQANVVGTLNVLQCARARGTSRVVHTSTSEVYGTARYVPIDEQHPLQGQSPYAATKIAADKLVESFHLSFGLPVVTVRPFNTFGPRQSARAVVPTIITQALTGHEIRLGHLHPTRDLNYVSNTVEGFIAAGQSDEAVGGTFNLGTGAEISVGDLASLVGELTGRSVTIRSDESRVRPRASEVDRLLADASRAREVLGWEPRVSLRDGLLQTIEWTRGSLERFRPGEYAV